MKATDLMIWDWVLISVWDCNPFPSKVTSINYNSYQGKDFADWIDTEDEEDIGMYNVQPIPITPEILDKNGIKLFSTYTHPYRDGEWEEGELEEAMKHYPMYVYQTLNPNITFVIRPNEQELKVCSSNYKTRVEKKEEVIFVHELQHALRICGIEKEVVL